MYRGVQLLSYERVSEQNMHLGYEKVGRVCPGVTVPWACRMELAALFDFDHLQTGISGHTKHTK